MFLKILQNSQENACVGVFLLKKRHRHSCFSVFLWVWRNFQEHLVYRTPPGDCCILLKEEKHALHSKLERTKKIWYCYVPIRIFLQNLVLKFFGPKKTRFKTRKRQFETFYYWHRFYFMFDLDKTNILGPNYTVNVLRSYANFSKFK